MIYDYIKLLKEKETAKQRIADLSNKLYIENNIKLSKENILSSKKMIKTYKTELDKTNNIEKEITYFHLSDKKIRFRY